MKTAYHNHGLARLLRPLMRVGHMPTGGQRRISRRFRRFASAWYGTMAAMRRCPVSP
jgi:hypothetical protein